MTDSTIPSTLLLILGVLLIVAGAGLALSGYNQTQAAEEWASQPRYCGAGEIGEVDCPENPYQGGGPKMVFGLLLALGGGVGLRYGTN